MPTMKKPVRLVTLRGAVLKKTQVEVAAEGRLFQSDVSKLERRESLVDVSVDTLTRYVESLGGELLLVARVKVGGKLVDYPLVGRNEPEEP